jgi:hypothetical protein
MLPLTAQKTLIQAGFGDDSRWLELDSRLMEAEKWD